jgi:HSP20 family protein
VRYAFMNDPFDFISNTRNSVTPRINVGHNKEGIMLQVSLPGFSRTDIDVEVANGRLNVRAKSNNAASNYEFSTQEFKIGDYTQSWSLPKNVNSDAVEAEYEAGILTVTLPYSQSNRENIRKIALG